MNAAEIKLDILKKLDSLKDNTLEEAYGMLLNFINGNTGVEDWQNMTKQQQEALELGIEELKRGEGRSHKDVMTDMKKKFLHE